MCAKRTTDRRGAPACANVEPVTDERLRDLERRSRAGGGPEDDARLLLERVRRGELTSEALELAATIGHTGACAALGRAPVGLPGLALVIAGGGDRRARAALALAELALPAWTFPTPPDQAAPGDPVRGAVTTLRAAQTRPGVGAAGVGDEAAVAIHAELGDAIHGAHPADLLRPLAARVVARAALLLGEQREWYALDGARLAAGLFGLERVRAALAAALLPPALRPPPLDGPPPEWIDEAGLIRRRLTSGVVTHERAMLAHALVHAPASEALGLSPARASDAGWLEAVEASGALGAVAGVRAVVAIAGRELARDPETAAGRALLAAEAWVLEPTPSSAEAAAAAARAAAASPGSYRLDPERHIRATFHVETAAPTLAPELGALAARAAARAGLHGVAPVDELREALEGGAPRGVDTLRDVIDEVVPWALGYADPVRERADAAPELA